MRDGTAHVTGTEWDGEAEQIKNTPKAGLYKCMYVFEEAEASSSLVISQVISGEVKTHTRRHSVMIQPDCYKLLVSADTNQMLARSEFLSLLNSLEHRFRINTRSIFSHSSFFSHIRLSSAEQVIYCPVGNVNYIASFENLEGGGERKSL